MSIDWLEQVIDDLSSIFKTASPWHITQCGENKQASKKYKIEKNSKKKKEKEEVKWGSRDGGRHEAHHQRLRRHHHDADRAIEGTGDAYIWRFSTS